MQTLRRCADEQNVCVDLLVTCRYLDIDKQLIENGAPKAFSRLGTSVKNSRTFAKALHNGGH